MLAHNCFNNLALRSQPALAMQSDTGVISNEVFLWAALRGHVPLHDAELAEYQATPSRTGISITEKHHI